MQDTDQWPNLILRLEGLGLFALALYLYHQSGQSWWLFALLFLLPDIAFAAYWLGPKIGSVVYNFTHQALLAPLGVVIGMSMGWSLVVAVSLIWLAHIGFDRILGYGLKYQSGFRHTHLGTIGRSSAP